ncbi:MAG TPA: replication initiation protein [Tenuifilaceae bacterium]|nr:replication initiation protein [Tenuifilaceae bacterium]
MKDKEITLAQANALTQARYNYTVVEKRAVYQIIKEVRSQFIERPDGQRDLFNDLVIRMKTGDLQGNDVQLREVYSSLKNLRRKSIWIEDDERVLEVGYINYFEHKKRDTHLEVQVSNKILPYLVELAEQFTTYSLTVAISLRTKYSQRFYEYCSQFKNIGFFYVSIDELREKMMLGDSYPRYALLKSKIIEPAYKELKKLYEAGQCDLYFNYSEDKAGRTVQGIKIAIVTREKQESPLKVEDCLHYVKQWLNSWLLTAKKPKNRAWVDGVIKQLQKNPDLIPKLYDRLKKLQDKEPSSNFAPLARHIIEEDYLS